MRHQAKLPNSLDTRVMPLSLTRSIFYKLLSLVTTDHFAKRIQNLIEKIITYAGGFASLIAISETISRKLTISIFLKHWWKYLVFNRIGSMIVWSSYSTFYRFIQHELTSFVLNLSQNHYNYLKSTMYI